MTGLKFSVEAGDYEEDMDLALKPRHLARFLSAEKARAVARIRSTERTGRCEGRKAYGEKDGEAEVVAKIKELRAARLTINEIADRLNCEGVKTRSGGRWHFTQVRRILSRS